MSIDTLVPATRGIPDMGGTIMAHDATADSTAECEWESYRATE